MLGQSDDRRVRRSRRLLKEGLLQLLREKKFPDISVRDITDRMDLNRGTFYLHYSDTYALLHSVEEDFLRDVQKMIDEHREETESAQTLRPLFEPLLDYIVEHHAICESLLCNSASSGFVGKLNKLIDSNGSELIRQKWPQMSEERMEYFLSYVAFGMVGLLHRWFETGMKLEKPELLKLADRIISSDAHELLET